MFTTLLSSLPVANAVSSVAPTTVGLINNFNPGTQIKASSAAVAAVRIPVTASQNSQTLTSVQVNFSGTGLATSDFATIATGATSGVALYKDDGGTPNAFDGTDSVVTLAASPDWVPSTTNIILTPATPVALSNSGVVTNFFVVIKTSGTAANNDEIIATIPVNGVVTLDGNGPATAFSANSFKVDTTAPTISAVTGYVGSASLNVKFSEPVQRVGNGNIVIGDTPFTFTDNGTSGGGAISAVAHNGGQDFATVTINGNHDSGDFTNTASTLAAGTNKIMDMAGNAMGTSAVDFTSPLAITTAALPTTFVGATYNTTLTASGGDGSYTFTVAGVNDTNTLSTLGLSLATNGALTGTVANVTGSYPVVFKVTDGAAVVAVKFFSINVTASSGASVPGITSLAPAGAAQNSTSLALTITGAATAFSGSSTVTFSVAGGGATGITVGSITSSSATSITLPITISSGATVGPRNITITTGTQVVTLINAFNVFASGASGLTIQAPSAAQVSTPIPPSFAFNPSSNATINAYRVTLKSGADFSTATTLWDYVFPKPSNEQNSNGSHCGATSCNLGYGTGTFNILTQPTPLAPSTTYYWQVKTYSQAYTAVTTDTVSVENTPVSSFTTINSITDTTPPSIIHRPVVGATASANLDMFARVVDNVATKDTTPTLVPRIYYCAGSGCTPANQTAGTYVGNGYFKFRIPSATISTAGTIIRYYLDATDGTNTANFKKPDNTPFQFTVVAAGATTITGSVKDSTDTCVAGVQGATVFAEGTGFFATSDGSCNYSVGSMTAGTYDLVAVKEGYSERFTMGIPTGSSGVPFKLSSGATGGFGGDTTKPKIKITLPGEGATNIFGGTGFKIAVVFSEAMSQNSVNKTGNIVVKEINLANGAGTDITTSKGSWTYYPSAPGIAGLPPHANMALWSLTSGQTLGDGKTIAVIASADVTDAAGNAIQGNQPDGSFAFSFSTGSTVTSSGFNAVTNTFAGGGVFGVGANMPPQVSGALPAPGSFNIPTNLKPTVTFSELMADSSGDYNPATYIKLFTVSSGAETDVSSAAIDTVNFYSSKTAYVALKNTFNSGFLAANTSYRLKVLGGLRSTGGISLAPPGQESNVMFTVDFKTGSGVSTSAPAITGTYPGDADTGIPVNISAINASFSQSLDSSTISGESFYLSAGSSVVNGTTEYRPNENQIYFIPSSALSPNTTYTLTATTSIKAFNQQALASTATKTFTTSSTADSTAPAISFVNADDYNLAITFSEPMVSAKATDSLNFAASILNISNYSLKYGASGFSSGGGTSISIPSSATLKYDAVSSTVTIGGYNGLTAATLQGQEILVTATNIKDRSGNAITVGTGTNTARAPINNSSTTKGALGPSDSSTSGFQGGGKAIPTNFSSATFGFAPPVEVRPFSMMAGFTTIYGVRLPISKQIPAGGQVVLTFPIGFDVSGAKQDTNSPMRNDLNGPGTGTPTFKCNGSTPISCGGAATVTGDDAAPTAGGVNDDGVTVNTSARTVTIHLSAATNAAGSDFLNLDIAGIKNSSVPKDFNTTGYTVDVKTKNGETLLESLTSNPFFVQSAGSYTLGGTITATANDQTGTMKVYLMSPMTGPMEATSADFAGGTTATYSFANLPAGDYALFTDQSVTLGSKEFTGKSTPERVLMTGNTTKNFSMANNTSGGTNVTISVDGPANEKVDIFAGSPTGFKVIQKTLNGTAGSENFTFNLADGEWNIGVGPQMPKGPMSGPASTPTYLPPKPITVRVLNGGSPAVSEASGTANDGTIVFTLTSSNKTIKGLVQDASGKVMADAEVYAYSPTGGFGTRTSTDTTGAFTLNVVDGSFIIGSFVPGMPPSKETPVVVNSDVAKGGHATNYLFINGASTGVAPATAASSFTLKVAKPDYTISGKVTDGTNVVQGASVFAYRTDGPGNANVLSGSDGTYTLYVTAGTWKVGTFLPTYGKLDEQTVAVTTASVANTNFSPTQGGGTYYTVAGRIYKELGGTADAYDDGTDSPVSNAFVRISGGTTSNEAITASDGTYVFQVPQCDTAGCYTVKAFAPGIGDLPPTSGFTVTGNVTGKNIAVGTLRTITITLSSSVERASVEFISNNNNARVEIENSTTGTLTIPNGSYKVNVFIPGANIPASSVAGSSGATVYNSTTGVVTVDGTEGVTVTLPTQRTITGTVTDGSSNIAEAWVEMVNPTTGVRFGTKSDTNGAFSFKAQDGAYSINAMKPGYFSGPTAVTVNASTAAQTLTISAASLTISGQVKIGSSGAANAFVRAEKQGGGFAGTQADANGNYTLYVTAGVWKIYAVAEGYAEVGLTTNPVTISSAALTGKDITLSTTVTLESPASKPITPASGGTLEDTELGMALTIPANALGSSSSAGNVEVKETNNYRETSTATPLSGAVREIKATDSTGAPINTLSDTATVELTLTKAELDDTNSSGGTPIDTEDEVKQLAMAYWDETTANWVNLATTVTFLDSSSNIVADPATNLSDVAGVVISAATDHFSLYAPVVATDPAAPTTPSGFAATTASTTQINLSWTAVESTGYDIYRSTTSDGTFTRIGSEPTVSSGATTTYSDTGLSSGTAYFYKITSINLNGESAASSEVTATTTAVSSSTNVSNTGGSVPNSSSGSSSKEKDAKKETKTEEEKKAEEAKAATAVESESTAETFKDVKGHWSAEFVAKLYAKGIVKGYDKDNYGPDKKITRAEFTKIVVTMFNLELPASVSASSFKDVKVTDWYSGYLEAAVTNKFIAGYSDKTFKPNQPINRAEAVKIILEASGMNLETIGAASFSDVNQTLWYAKYINYASEKGIVNGYEDKTFGPTKNLTRAEVAKIASLILDMAKSEEDSEEL
ncbi:MAG: S-layer homology domain-containing protein [Patescibacteria group bacterium]